MAAAAVSTAPTMSRPATPALSAARPGAAPTSLGDFHAGPTSPVIDTGNNDAAFNPSLPEGATIAAVAPDLGSAARIVAVRSTPAQIDLGAYEAANLPPVFTTTPDPWQGVNADYTYRRLPRIPTSRACGCRSWPRPNRSGSALPCSPMGPANCRAPAQELFGSLRSRPACDRQPGGCGAAALCAAGETLCTSGLSCRRCW